MIYEEVAVIERGEDIKISKDANMFTAIFYK